MRRGGDDDDPSRGCMFVCYRVPHLSKSRFSEISRPSKIRCRYIKVGTAGPETFRNQTAFDFGI